MKGSITQLHAAVPGLHYTIEHKIVEGDKLVHFITGHGTMTGPFIGIPPTGQSATWQEVHIVRLAGAQVVESWAVVDSLGMLIQFGVMPAPGGAPVSG